jgi:TonB family protein
MRSPILVVSLTIAGPAALVPAQAAAQAPASVRSNIPAPVKVHHVEPEYPEDARRAGIEDAVIVEATVDAKGIVESTRVLRSVVMLDEPAVAAIRQWRYKPVLINGAPVPFITLVTVPFPSDYPADLIPRPSSAVDSPSNLPRPSAGARTMRAARPGFIDHYELTAGRRASLPQWSPSGGAEPPLPSGAALLAAQSWMHQKNANPVSRPVIENNLTELLGTWLYRIRFGPLAGERQLSQPVVLVLLDGSIVEPRSEPR